METLTFSLGQKTFECTLTRPAETGHPSPAVLIVPDWMGPGAYWNELAGKLAGLGYAGFVADLYGTDTRPRDDKEAAGIAGGLRAGKRTDLRNRMKAALDLLRRQPGIDHGRIVAIGYCFGGSATLELARTGADIAGVVTIHGGLAGGEPGTAGAIKARVLVLHGTEDPVAPWEDMTALVKEFDAADVDLQVIGYGGAHHSFTQPGANIPGKLAYDPRAAARSWDHLKLFLQQTFAEG